MTQAIALLDSLTLLRLSTALCERAAVLDPVVLRNLDALHLAAALELGDELEGIVTYDGRLTRLPEHLASEPLLLGTSVARVGLGHRRRGV